MADINKIFDSYSITYVAGPATQLSQAVISCYNGSTAAGRIYFYANGSGLPSNKQEADGSITLYYEISRFNDVVSLLRYEKPLALYLISTSSYGYIYTGSHEPVGEQEGV
jgi:hypothetical protein